MKRTICSIYFQPLKAVRPFKPRTRETGYLETFVLPAAPRNGFTTLTVDDMDESVRMSSEMDPFPTPVFGDKVAADLINEWAGGVAGEAFGGPGVFICAGDEPTEAELAAARQKQTKWCNWLVNEAQGNWIQGNRHLIRNQHRDAAAWMGLGDLDWVKNPEQRNSKKCPLCRTDVDADAIVCPNCRQVIDFKAFANYERNRRDAEEIAARLRQETLEANPELAESEEFAETVNPQ